MNHPVNKYKTALETQAKVLHTCKHNYTRLETIHTRLVEDSVVADHTLDIFIESVESFCRVCNIRLTKSCELCPLRPAAIRCAFWKEEE